MGIYDTYGKLGIQLKVEDVDDMRHFFVGDKVTLPSGVYVSHEGIVVVKDGVFIAEFPVAMSKWGSTLTPKEILDPIDPFRRLISDITDKRQSKSS